MWVPFPPSQPTPLMSSTARKSNLGGAGPGKETKAGHPWPVTLVQPVGKWAFEQ